MSAQGFVYFLVTTDWRFVKIGRTIDLNKRFRLLSIQLPFPVFLYHAIETDDPVWLESLIHTQWKTLRVNGEWFCTESKEDFEATIGKWSARDYWTRERQCELEQMVSRQIREIKQSGLPPLEEFGSIVDACYEAGL